MLDIISGFGQLLIIVGFIGLAVECKKIWNHLDPPDDDPPFAI